MMFNPMMMPFMYPPQMSQPAPPPPAPKQSEAPPSLPVVMVYTPGDDGNMTPIAVVDIPGVGYVLAAQVMKLMIPVMGGINAEQQQQQQLQMMQMQHLNPGMIGQPLPPVPPVPPKRDHVLKEVWG